MAKQIPINEVTPNEQIEACRIGRELARMGQKLIRSTASWDDLLRVSSDLDTVSKEMDKLVFQGDW